jgi:hypothetical protein
MFALGSGMLKFTQVKDAAVSRPDTKIETAKMRLESEFGGRYCKDFWRNGDGYILFCR